MRRHLMVEASSSADMPSVLQVANILAHPVRLMNPKQEPVVLPLKVSVTELCKPEKVLQKELVAFEEAVGERRVGEPCLKEARVEP